MSGAPTPAAAPDGEPGLRVDRDGPVRLLTLDRPDRRNALTPRLQHALDRQLRAADADPDCRAVVLTGAGSAFCAGADVQLLAQPAAALVDAIADTGRLPTLPAAMRTPVIAAVNGPAVGLGMVYAVTCDIRLATGTAVFTSAFAQLGLVAEYGLAWYLQRHVGLSRAAEILLTGRPVTAREALQIGLVHQLHPAVQLTAKAVEVGHRLAEGSSPASVAAIKAQLWADAGRTGEQAVDASIIQMIASVHGPDLAEALAARRERRAPRFAALPPVELVTGEGAPADAFGACSGASQWRDPAAPADPAESDLPHRVRSGPEPDAHPPRANPPAGTVDS